MRALLLLMVLVTAECYGQPTPSVAAGSSIAPEVDVVVAFLTHSYPDCVKSNAALVIEDTFSIAALRMRCARFIVPQWVS